MANKLRELGSMLLILVFLGVVGYFCAGLHVRDDGVAFDAECITTP